MADQQRRVSLIFDADSSRAKAQIQDLTQSINKLMNSSMRSTNVASLDKELQEATRNAALLQTQLQKAVNANTGKLDLTKFNDSLRESGMSLDRYQQSFAKVGSAGQQAFTGLARSIATAEIPLRRTNSLLNDFAVTMKNTVKWQLSSSLMHGFLSSIQSAMSYAQNLNSNLNDIRIVTGQSAEEMARFADMANKSAQQLSTTTNQYAKAALIFYQQGLNDKAVKERTETVIKMANVTGEAAKDVSSYMTAIWNNFDDGSKSLEYYADVITKLGAATAASSEEIAGGLEKFAAVGKTIGLSYEYATAMLTTIIDKTRQSEDVVGTALKTILARIQGLNLGETLEDGTTLNKYSAALATVGVQIKDTSGQLRDMDAILKDLGGKWQTLSKDTQVALAQVVGGVRQYNQIISLMDNWDSFEVNLDIALNSDGELNKQSEIFAESWEAARNRVQAAMEDIYSSLINDKSFIKLNDTFAELLKGINSFIDGIGGMSGVLTGLGSIILTVFNKQITASLKDLTNNLRMMTKSGQEELITLQKKAQQLLIGQDYGKGEGGKGVKAAYESEARAQLALINNAKKLTEEELAVTNILMQQHQLRVDEQVAISNQVTELEKVEKAQIASFDRAKEKLADLAQPFFTTAGMVSEFDAVSQEVIELQSDVTNLGNSIDLAFGSGEGGDAQAAQHLLKSIDDITPKTKEAIDAVNAFKQAMADAGGNEGAQAEAFKGIKNALYDLEDSLFSSQQKVEQLFANLKKWGEGNEAFTRAIEVAEQAYKRLSNTSEELNNKKNELINSNKRLAASEEAVKAALQASGAVYLSTQQMIVAFGQMASTIGSVINTIKGLVTSFKEGNATIGQVLTSVGFLIPQLLSLYKNFKNITMTTYGAIAAGKLFSTQKLAEAAATNVAKGAVISFGTALKTSLPIYGIIVTAITAVVAALIALYKAANAPTALEKHQENFKKLQKEIKDLEEDSKTINSTINQLYDDFSEYEEAYTALEKLTEGTSAWKDQLLSVKSISQGLIESWPILQKIIENPEKFGVVGQIFNADGSLNPEVVKLAHELQVQEQTFTGTSSAMRVSEAEIQEREAAEGIVSEDTRNSFYEFDQEGFLGGKTFMPVEYARSFFPEFAGEIYGTHAFDSSITTDQEMFSGKHILDYIKTIPEYYDASIGEYTDIGKQLITDHIGFDGNAGGLMQGYFFDEEGNKAAVRDTVVEAIMDAGDGALELDKRGETPFGFTDTATTEQIDAIFLAGFNAAIKSEPDTTIMSSIGSRVDPAAIEALKERPDSYKTSAYMGNQMLYSAGMTSEDFTAGGTMAKALGAAIAEEAEAAISEGSYEDIDADDFRAMFPFLNEVAYKDGELSYANSEYTGQEGEEERIIIPDGKLLYAMTDIAKQQGSALGTQENKYAAAASYLGYTGEIQEVISKFFENNGDLNSMTMDEVAALLETDIKSLIPNPEEVQKNIETAIELGIGVDKGYNVAALSGKAPLLLDSLKGLLGDESLTNEQLQAILNGDYNTSEGRLQIADIIRPINDEFATAAEELERGIAPVKRYSKLVGNMGEVAEAVMSLNFGDTINEKQYGTLEDAGLDLSEVHWSGESPGEFEGKIDITSVLDSMLETQILGEKFDLSSNEPISSETKKEILEYLGYNVANATPEIIDSLFSEISDETLKYIDTYQIDEEVANFVGVLGFGVEKYLGSYSDEYAMAMAQAQAQIDGKDWDTLLAYAGPEGIKDKASYDMAVTDLNRQTGVNQLISGLEGWVKDLSGIINNEDFEELTAEGSELGNTLQELIDALSLVLGFEVDSKFVQDNWGWIDDLLDKGKGWDTLTALYNRGALTGYTSEDNWGMSAETFAPYETQLDYAFLQEAAEVKAGDIYSQAAQAILSGFNATSGFEGVNRNLFDMALQDSNLWDSKNNKIANEELFKKWLEESGIADIYDEDGKLLSEAIILDENLIEAGYDTVEEVIALFTNAMIAGAGEFDIASSGFDKVVRDIYSNMDFASQVDDNGLKIWATTDQMATGAEALNKAYSAGGIQGLTQVADWLKNAGANAPQLADALAGIDWNASNAFDLASAALSTAGLNAEDYTEAINFVISATQVAVEALTTLAEAIGLFSSSTDLADQIRNGEAFGDDGYKLLEEVYGPEVARAAVTRQADGNYIATSGNNEFLAMGLEQNAVSGFEEVRRDNQEFLNSAYMMNDTWTSMDASWLKYLANSTDDYGLTEEQKTSMRQYGELTTDEGRRLWADQMAAEGIDWETVKQQASANATRYTEEAGEMIADAETRIPRENMEAGWAAEGFSGEDIELIDKYGDSIQELAKDSEYLSEELIENADAADEIASELMRYEKGLQKVVESTKDWSKSLKENTKGSDEYIKTTEDMSDALEDIYDLGDGALDGLDLDWERLNEDMVKIAEGSAEEAVEAYQDGIDVINDAMILDAGLVPDLDMTQFESGLSDSLVSMNEWQNLVYDALNNIEAGGIIDGALLSSLESMLNACYSTAADAQAALTSMGVDGQVVIADEPITNTTPTNDIRASIVDNGYLSVPVVAGDGSVTMGPKIPIQGVKYSAVPNTNISEGSIQNVGFKIVPGTGKTNVTRKAGGGAKSGMGSRPARSGGGGGGGGGGGSRAPRGEKKQASDKERYHTITNQLEDLTDAYDKVSKAADRAFGKSRIKLLREQQEALKDLAATQQDYIDEINDYYQQDLDNLDQVSAFAGVDIQMDENGTITNFDEIQDAMWAEYNSHINENGEVTDMDEEAWKKYQEEWERIMALIAQYEETQDERKEALQQLQDYINQIYDLQLEEVTYAVEIDIEASEDALEILDYLLGRIEDDAWKAAEAITYMGEQATVMLDQNDTNTSGIRRILMNHTEDLYDSKDRLIQKAQLTEADVEGFMSGDPEAINKILGMDNIFTEEEIQSLRDYHSSLIEMNQTLVELRESVFDKVLESFEQFNEEMDKSIDKIDHLSAVTDNYKNIIDIVGKKNLNISNALLDSLNQASTEQRINRVEATRTKRDTIAAEIATAEAALADARAKGLEEDAKLWEKTLEEMRTSLDEAEEDFMQSWEDALDSIRQQFEEAIGHAVETLSDALAGPLMGSMDELQEAFDRQNTVAERYLPDYEKIYELNKLNRDITNSIDETDNIKAKQELAALQAEINALEESEAQISEYQMENLRRRYELKQAEIALTEAQDAKSQVQMSRDADGNWSYVYTANEDQVAEAEQTYEDRLYAMQEANAEYINAMNDSIIQMQAEMTQKIEEIMMDETLSAEEKMARVQEVTTFYQEQMGYYMGELELVLGENQVLYEEDWAKYSELTGYKISANEDYVDNFNETALSTLTGFQTMEEFQQNFNDAIGHPDSHGLLYDLSQAYNTWAANTEAAMNAAGTSVSDFAEW